MKVEDACAGVRESCQPGLPTGDAFLEELAKRSPNTCRNRMTHPCPEPAAQRDSLEQKPP